MVVSTAVGDFCPIMFPLNLCELISFFDSRISSNRLNKNVFTVLFMRLSSRRWLIKNNRIAPEKFVQWWLLQKPLKICHFQYQTSRNLERVLEEFESCLLTNKLKIFGFMVCQMQYRFFEIQFGWCSFWLILKVFISSFAIRPYIVICDKTFRLTIKVYQENPVFVSASLLLSFEVLEARKICWILF